MSTASGITAEGGGKMHPALPRKQRGFRLAVVFAAVALCWGWSLNWASGRSFPGLQTMGVRLSEFGPFFLGAAVSLVCLGWASKLIWDRMAQSRSAARVAAHPQASTERKPWIASQELKAIATVLFSGLCARDIPCQRRRPVARAHQRLLQHVAQQSARW
jgi:hypothetical protein